MTRHVPFAFALALVAAPAIAADRPTSADIAAARGECREYRLRVAKLEKSGKASPAELQWERSAWDRACAYAERLMVQAGIEKPSAPVVAPPVAEIVITEHKPAPGAEFASAPASTAAPAPAASPAPAAAPAPVIQPKLELKHWPVDELVIKEPVPAETATAAK
jgi:hypothetical protein